MKTNLVIIATMLAIVFSSCSESEEFENGNTERAISFKSERIMGATKGAVEKTNSNWKKGDAFGVYAANAELADFGNGDYIPNLKVTNSAEDKLSPMWAYEGPAYVYPGTNVSFVAYSPYSAAQPLDPAYHATPILAAKNLALSFKMAETVDAQVDLLWGTVPGQSAGSAAIAFKHALSKLMFQVKVGGNYFGGIVLKSIKLTNAAKQGVANIAIGTLPAITWISDTEEANLIDYTAYLGTMNVTETAVAVPSSDLLLIPKVVNGLEPSATDCKVVITYSINGATDKTETLTLKNNWVSGSSYLYVITITAEGITFTTDKFLEWTPEVVEGAFVPEIIN